MDSFRQRVVFSPGEVTRSYGSFKPGTHRGRVTRGDWDLKVHPFETNPLARAALRHWRDGEDWESTGVVEYQLKRIRQFGTLYADRLASRDDVLRRYDRLDDLFDLVRRTGELPPEANAQDGIYVHVGRDGRAIFGHRGVHRFVITHVLGVPEVIGQLGAIHPRAPQAVRYMLRRRTPAIAWLEDGAPRPEGVLQRLDPRFRAPSVPRGPAGRRRLPGRAARESTMPGTPATSPLG